MSASILRTAAMTAAIALAGAAPGAAQEGTRAAEPGDGKTAEFVALTMEYEWRRPAQTPLAHNRLTLP